MIKTKKQKPLHILRLALLYILRYTHDIHLQHKDKYTVDMITFILTQKLASFIRCINHLIVPYLHLSPFSSLCEGV
jgi:hypothetical protein